MRHLKVEREEKIYKYVTIGYCYGSSSLGNGDRKDNENCGIYGRLYSWWPEAMDCFSTASEAPSDFQGVCPNGWHLANTMEWRGLIEAAGGHQFSWSAV
jgi:uncharacterized protein (TIGR02145 family)